MTLPPRPWEPRPSNSTAVLPLFPSRLSPKKRRGSACSNGPLPIMPAPCWTRLSGISMTGGIFTSRWSTFTEPPPSRSTNDLRYVHALPPDAPAVTGHLDSLLALERAGAGAVVLPSLFEEQIENEQMGIHLSLELGAGIFGEATGGYLPEADRYNTGTDRYLDLIRTAKTALSIPVIGSLNGTTTGGWVRYAGLIENAGADALELNIYLVAADASLSAAEVEYGYLSLVEATREAGDLPLAGKIGPYFSSVATTGGAL